jgi:hypothetical protein
MQRDEEKLKRSFLPFPTKPLPIDLKSLGQIHQFDQMGNVNHHSPKQSA